MSTTPRVISEVVDNDLCIGCGMCIYSCPSDALSITWNENGFLVPELANSCDDEGACIDVCPFNPNPKEIIKDETAIANIFLSEGTTHNDKLGKLINIYAGYSNEFRLTSSSGGMATYIFKQLLERGIVDHIVTVRYSETMEAYYEYQVSSSINDIQKSSKTRYYPVSLATALNKLDDLEGSVAIVGVACFIKSIRLAQFHNPKLKQKIPFVVGIICGGVKSKFFTEYVASKAGANIDKIESPEYRVKDLDSTAGDYSFSCIDTSSNNKTTKKIKMREVGDMWGSGLFKSNACDFCDDVVTELADISLGDAWLKPYIEDGQGTSLVITRSPLADTILQEGLQHKELVLEDISPETMRSSQQGSYNHRHQGLYVRLKEARRKGVPIAEKRYGKKPVSADIKVLQRLRRLARKNSLKIWKKTKSAESFDKEMRKLMVSLRVVTKATQLKRRFIKRLGINRQ